MTARARVEGTREIHLGFTLQRGEKTSLLVQMVVDVGGDLCKRERPLDSVVFRDVLFAALMG